MNDLNRLRDEHVKLATIAGRLSTMIAQDAPPPAQMLYTVRTELASELICHLKTEDWIVYPRLLASSNVRVAETSRAFSQEMGRLAEEFRDYTDRWVSYEIESDWKGYRRETAKILGALSKRMKREERDLYPLLGATVRAAA